MTNRDRLLDAAERQLEAVGFDHVTVSGLTREAGVSRGTLYAYFGDVDGVYASFWAEHGASWLRRVMTAVPTSPTVSDERHDTLAALLAVARRVPALEEVIRPDLDAAWAEVTDDTAASRVRATWLLAGVLGLHLLRDTAPHVEEVAPIAQLVAVMPDEVDEQLNLSPWVQPEQTPYVDTPRIDDADDARIRLAQADMKVIASAGVAAATMMRVCRVARVSTGTAAPRFESLRDLHHSTFELALRDVADTNSAQIDRFASDRSIPDTYALFVAAALEPQRRLWRRYRQELLIASRHDPITAEAVRRSFTTTDAALEATFAALGLSSDQVQLVLRFNLLYAVGLAAVLELLPPLDAREHRSVLNWLFSLVLSDTTE